MKSPDRLELYILKVGSVAKIANLKFWTVFMLASSALAHASLEKDSLSGHLGVMSNHFNSDIGDVPGNRFNVNGSLDYYKPINDDSENELERRFTGAALQNDVGLLMYSVQEAYIAVGRKHQFKIGRQILDWSAIDPIWGFGKLNNRRNFDFFEPGQEGLTGVSYKAKFDNGLRVSVFASPIYIPEMNPSLEIDDKRKTVRSRNPWADVPSRSTVYNTRAIPVEYDVDYPSISEAIYRASGGINVGYESKHWVFDNFFIRKPENNVSTLVDFEYNTIRDVLEVDVTPKFYYHDVYGSTLKYRNDDLQMYVSGIAIRPNEFPDGNVEATRYTNIKTGKKREDYVGGGISKTNDVYSIGINYVARLSPFNRLKEELPQDPRWNQAVNVFGSRNLTSKLSVFGDVKYDMLTADRLVMARIFYNVTRSFMVTGGMNLIGTPEDGKSYWSPWTNNDQLYVGARYIF
jgi:hypothetical protein